MSNLHDLIREHHDGDPDSTAVAVFAALGTPAKWRDVFYSVVRDECRRQGRQATVAAILDAASGQPSADAQPPVAAGRVDYLASRIYCGPERGYVPLGEMSVADHELRIAAQARLRLGIDADIERHLAYIDEIQAAGVACLNDLHVAKAAA